MASRWKKLREYARRVLEQMRNAMGHMAGEPQLVPVAVRRRRDR